MPAHHNLGEYVAAYIEAVGMGNAKYTSLFRTVRGKTQQLTERRLSQPEVYLMIRRRAAGAGIKTLIGYHTFRARDRHHLLSQERREARNRAADGRT